MNAIDIHIKFGSRVGHCSSIQGRARSCGEYDIKITTLVQFIAVHHLAQEGILQICGREFHLHAGTIYSRTNTEDREPIYANALQLKAFSTPDGEGRTARNRKDFLAVGRNLHRRISEINEHFTIGFLSDGYSTTHLEYISDIDIDSSAELEYIFNGIENDTDRSRIGCIGNSDLTINGLAGCIYVNYRRTAYIHAGDTYDANVTFSMQGIAPIRESHQTHLCITEEYANRIRIYDALTDFIRSLSDE